MSFIWGLIGLVLIAFLVITIVLGIRFLWGSSASGGRKQYYPPRQSPSSKGGTYYVKAKVQEPEPDRPACRTRPTAETRRRMEVEKYYRLTILSQGEHEETPIPVEPDTVFAPRAHE